MKLQSAGTVAGLTGAALILATFVASGAAQSTDRQMANAAVELDRSGKGHRLPAEPSARQPSRVTAVELVGLSQTTVILRDRDGTVIYRSDPVTNTTLVGKDVDFPTVTIKEAADSTAQRQPARRMESKEQPATQPKRPMPVGCEGVVSILVDQDSRRVPGLCLS
jgi:hypothetical protein